MIFFKRNAFLLVVGLTILGGISYKILPPRELNLSTLVSATKLTSITFTTLSFSPTTTYTPKVDGNYKIPSPVPFFSALKEKPAITRIYNSSQNATLLYESYISNYSLPTKKVEALTLSVYALKAGVPYVFDVQGRVEGGLGYLEDTDFKISVELIEAKKSSLSPNEKIGKEAVKKVTDYGPYHYNYNEYGLLESVTSPGKVLHLTYNNISQIATIQENNDTPLSIKYESRFNKPALAILPGVGYLRMDYDEKGTIKNVTSSSNKKVVERIRLIFSHLIGVNDIEYSKATVKTFSFKKTPLN